jgi:single-strand DNA-binding protein
MNKYINNMQISGRLGSDVTFLKFEDGSVKARFSVATNEVFSDKTQRTQWHDIVAWEYHARYSNIYLKKGDWVTLEGRLNYRGYEDSEGVARYVAEIIVTKIQKQ